MAFTGVAVVQQISSTKVRITGLSLAGAAAGTIGLDGDAGAGVQLPGAFDPKPYLFSGVEVGLAASLEVSIWRADGAGTGVGDVITAKGGDPFRITLTNDDAQNATAEMEIYVTFHE